MLCLHIWIQQQHKLLDSGNTKEKHRKHFRTYGVDLVAWGGIEPPTRGFSVRCSTN